MLCCVESTDGGHRAHHRRHHHHLLYQLWQERAEAQSDQHVSAIVAEAIAAHEGEDKKPAAKETKLNEI